MKKLLRGSISLAAIIVGPAMAADMAVKTPPQAAYYYDWSGVYIGASIGSVWTNVDRFYPNLPIVGLPPTTFTSRSSDVLYDIHAGAQVQWGWLILGVEASPTCSRSGRGSALLGIAGWSTAPAAMQLPASKDSTSAPTAASKCCRDRVPAALSSGHWLLLISAETPGTKVGMPAAGSNTWFTRARWLMSSLAPNISIST